MVRLGFLSFLPEPRRTRQWLTPTDTVVNSNHKIRTAPQQHNYAPTSFIDRCSLYSCSKKHDGSWIVLHELVDARSERRHECCSQVLIYLVPGPGITSSYSYMRILVSGADDVVRGTAVYQVPGIHNQQHSRWICCWIHTVRTRCRATCEASKQQNTEIRPDERRSKPAAVAR